MALMDIVLLRRFSECFSSQKPQGKTRQLSPELEWEVPRAYPPWHIGGTLGPLSHLSRPSAGTQVGWGERPHGQVTDTCDRWSLPLPLPGHILSKMVEKKPEANAVMTLQSLLKVSLVKAIKD